MSTLTNFLYILGSKGSLLINFANIFISSHEIAASSWISDIITGIININTIK